MPPVDQDFEGACALCELPPARETSKESFKAAFACNSRKERRGTKKPRNTQPRRVSGKSGNGAPESSAGRGALLAPLRAGHGNAAHIRERGLEACTSRVKSKVMVVALCLYDKVGPQPLRLRTGAAGPLIGAKARIKTSIRLLNDVFMAIS